MSKAVPLCPDCLHTLDRHNRGGGCRSCVCPNGNSAKPTASFEETVHQILVDHNSQFGNKLDGVWIEDPWVTHANTIAGIVAAHKAALKAELEGLRDGTSQLIHKYKKPLRASEDKYKRGLEAVRVVITTRIQTLTEDK